MRKKGEPPQWRLALYVFKPDISASRRSNGGAYSLISWS
jgi:hypothetical protein